MAKSNQNNYNNIKSKTFYRSVTIEKGAVDVENRSVKLSFSSETAVDRGGYYEILGHRADEVDLTRLQGGSAPLLLEHDRSKQIGVIESADTSDARGEAVVRFSRSSLGEEILQDVADGIRSQVSTAYKITDIVEQGMEGNKKVLRLRWQPVEISIVSIAADDTVGVGRSETEAVEIPKLEENKRTMDNIEKDTTIVVNETLSTERQRIAEIMSVGKRHGYDAESEKFIEQGKPAEEFRKFVLEQISNKQKEIINANRTDDVDLSDREAKQYDIARAINAQMSGRFREMAPFESELSDHVAKRSGLDAKGFWVPWKLQKRAAGDPATWTTEATNVVQTKLAAQDFIGLLGSKLVLAQMGVTQYNGLIGNVDIPRFSSGVDVEVPATENAGATGSTVAFDKVSLVPHDLIAVAPISKKLLRQSMVDVNAIVLNEIAKQLARKIQYGALYGSGISGNPSGLMTLAINNGNLTTSTGITHANVVNLETLVAVDDADEGALGYITNATVRGYLKTHAINATYGETMIWAESGQPGVGILNGYKSMVTSTILSSPYSALIFGAWNDLIIATFGPGIDINIDDKSKSKELIINIVADTSYDIGCKYLNAFASMENIAV